MAFTVSPRSIPEILTDMVNQFSTLLGKEGQLARAELAENIAKAAAGVGLAVGEPALEAGKEEAEKHGLTPAQTRSGDRGSSGAGLAAGAPSDENGEAAVHGAREATPHGAA
ncbi:MAG: hypothetical protein ACREFL_09785 [Stellaceae bacterium]